MMDCSEKRKEFERKGGRKLGSLGVAVAKKKRRRGKRGGKRTLRTRMAKKYSWKPDLSKDILATE
jgi:hypothetical protein